MKEIIMGTIKLIIFAVAIVVGIPAVSALAARQLTVESEHGAGCVHVAASAHPVLPPLPVRRLGGEGMFVADDTLLTRKSPTSFAGVLPKPGRA
jgi:hypothetical protein